MYEKALRYSDQSITLTSNSDWTGSCIVQVPSAPHVTHKNVRLRSTYGDDDYYGPNGDIYGEDEDDEEDDEEDDNDEDDDDVGDEEDDEEEDDVEEEEEEDEDAILQDRINQINADGDEEGDGNGRNEDEDWGDVFDGRQIQYFEPPYAGPNCLRPLFPPGFAGPTIVLGHDRNNNSDNNEDNMGNKQDDDVIMGENEVEMKDRRRGNKVDVETRLKNNGDDKSEDDNFNEIKTERYTKEDVGMSCDEYENGQTEEITINHTIKCTSQSALSTPIASSSSSNQHIAQPLLFNIMSKDILHREEKKFCTENFQKSVSRTLSPYFTECDVDHNYTNMNMSEGEETTLESVNDKLFKNTNTGIKNGKNGVNKIEQDEREEEEGDDVGGVKGTDDKMEDCLEWLQKREEVMEREIAISIISAVQRHVVEDSMTELSLACLSNLIATELQVSPSNYPSFLACLCVFLFAIYLHPLLSRSLNLYHFTSVI